MTTVALYQLAAEYREQAAKLADLELDPETLQDTLESLSGDLEAKAANVAMFIRNIEASVAAMKEAEKALKARREATERRAEHVRRYLLQTLQACGITKVESPLLRIAVRANPASVEVFDEAQLPAEFLRTPEPPPPPAPAPDKAAIKAALEAGQEVPGARLVRLARLAIG